MTTNANRGAAEAVASVVTAERTRMVASLIRLTGDWDLAEDCVQDAVERALVRWPREGMPRSPAAWLTTTARNRALDVLRRRQTERAKLQERATMDEMGPGGTGGTGPGGTGRLGPGGTGRLGPARGTDLGAAGGRVPGPPEV